MEPCLFRHGKEDLIRSAQSTEIASMEPCLFRHGKGVSKSQVQRDIEKASMEPCLFRHGKSAVMRATRNRAEASMEPCLFRHGKTSNVILLSSSALGFNGAMSFQTW